MSLVLSELKQINHKDGLLVFGFVRITLTQELSVSNVPPIIQYLCLGFYFSRNYFAKCGKCIGVSNDRMTVTAIEQAWWDTKYGWQGPGLCYTNIWIPSMSNKVVTWAIKINKMLKNMYFGIMSTDDFDNGSRPNYGFTNNSTATFGDITWKNPNYDRPFKQGDIITVVLNLNDASFGKIKNNGYLSILYKGIQRGDDIRYKLAVRPFYKDDSVTLLGYKVCDVDDYYDYCIVV